MDIVHQLYQSVSKNTEIIESLGDYTSGNFEVCSAPVGFTDSDGVYHSTDQNRVLYRKDTQEVLNVVGARYQMAQYRDMWQAAERVLIKSGLDLTGLTRRMEQSANGGRAYAVYTLPSYSFDSGDGDVSQLQITAYGSFDGSWCFVLVVGSVRIICTNTQVSIGNFCLYKAKHTPSLNIDLGVIKISTVLGAYEQERERWGRWKDQDISEREAFSVFAEAAKCKFVKARPTDTVNALIAEPEVYRNKALGYMWTQYTQYEREALGSNQWAVYNTMTHWATHAEAARKKTQANISVLQVNRGNVVSDTARLRLAA